MPVFIVPKRKPSNNLWLEKLYNTKPLAWSKNHALHGTNPKLTGHHNVNLYMNYGGDGLADYTCRRNI